MIILVFALPKQLLCPNNTFDIIKSWSEYISRRKNFILLNYDFLKSESQCFSVRNLTIPFLCLVLHSLASSGQDSYLMASVKSTEYSFSFSFIILRVNAGPQHRMVTFLHIKVKSSKFNGY